MELPRIIFISIATLSIIGLSVLAGRVISIGLQLDKKTNLIVLGISFILPALFIFVLILARNGLALDGFAPIVSTMLAVVTAIVGVSVLIAIIVAFGMITGNTPPTIIVKLILFFGVLAGIFGVIQTQFLKIKEYTVTLSTLPDSWKGRKIILISDTHYGIMINKKSAERVVKKIQEINPSFVLHAGDLFDGPDIDTEKVLAPWKVLTASTPVFYASGNHEEYGPYQKFIDAARASGFMVLNNSNTTYDGITIAGITYIQKQNKEIAESSLQMALPQNNTNPTILINHHPAFLDKAEKHGVDLMVSGHTHRGQFWPIRYLTRAVYGKYYYGKNQFNDMTVLTTAGTGFSVLPLRLFTTPEIVVITFEK